MLSARAALILSENKKNGLGVSIISRRWNRIYRAMFSKDEADRLFCLAGTTAPRTISAAAVYASVIVGGTLRFTLGGL